MRTAQHSRYLTKLDRNNTNFTKQLFEYFKNAKWDSNYSFLKYYQNLVRVFINDVDIDARGSLVIHEMGMGKSILAVAIAIDLIKERQPIILLTKSLQENMRNSIIKYAVLRKQVDPDFYLCKMIENGPTSPELEAWIDKNFSFVSMNASNMLKQMNRAAEGHTTDEFDAAMEKNFGEVLKLSSLDGKLLIVDEAHNLFRAITNGSKNAQGLYDMVMKAKNLKIVFLTGTPIANDPFELVPCFNMIGSKSGVPILPESYKEFNKLFVDTTNGRIKNKEKFQNRIFGLVSRVNHHSHPGKAFGIGESATKAEFPTELPIIVERINMDDDQYVIYQLARDKEKEEGNRSGPGNASARHGLVEAPSMTKPKGKASSTYRVKSRQLSNFCAPNSHREEKDPAAIPKTSLASAKFKKMLLNIGKHKNQLGLVYSQFVGVGGLGTFSQYLDSLGWKKVELTPPKRMKQHPQKIINDFEPTQPDQGELDESINTTDISGLLNEDIKDNINEDISSEGVLNDVAVNEIIDANVSDIIGSGAAVPSIDQLLSDLDKIGGSRYYGDNNDNYDVDNTIWWLTNDDQVRGGTENTENIESTENTNDISEITEIVSLLTDSSLTDSSLTDSSLIDSSLTDSSVDIAPATQRITFKYATADDVDIIKKLNPKYEHNEQNIKYPKYVLIVLENENPIGYVCVEYSIKDATEANATVTCVGKITDYHLDKDDSVVIRKIIQDAISCRDETSVFRKNIWGGDDSGMIVDPIGATPGARPDREYTYTIISGDVDVVDRTRLQNIFNADNNRHGTVIDLMLISSTGAEGLDLKNGRHVHIMEPYWNWSRIKQIISRFVRNDSHKSLPQNEKNVQPYIYLAIPPQSEQTANGYPSTTDSELYEEALMKQVTADSFFDTINEVSIECLANDEPHCRSCNPTGQKLFTDDPSRDVRAIDPCTEIKEINVSVEEIIIETDGIASKYYFKADPTSLYDYRIFIFDETINAFRPLKESDSRYEMIVNMIKNKR